MSTKVVRANPARVPDTLKEAVVDSLLNLTYSKLSGQGPSGDFLFGARPRALLNSGFLLPRKSVTGDDEVTSPIWVSSHGLQMQLHAKARGRIEVTPAMALYVRVLPSEADLALPNCKPVFMVKREVTKELQHEKKRRLDELWESIKGEHISRWKHPDWPRLRAEVVDAIYKERGIPRHLLGGDYEVEAETTPSPDSVDSDIREGVEVPVSAPLPVRDDHFEPLKVPHKWMRLAVDLPSLELDPALAPDDLKSALEEHAARMNAAVATKLKDWAESDDPLAGGKAWGYRHQLTVPPSQYHSWAEFLANVRRSDLRIALPEILLSWDVEVHQDWLDPSKRNMFLALENISNQPQKHSDETDEAVFLVNLRVKLPADLHQPLKLERIEPSYRYNSYLGYAAMGHNCGVAGVESTPDFEVLQTTWTPRYTQPRIVPTSSNGVLRKVRDLASPEGLDGLASLVPAMRKWLDGPTRNRSPRRRN